MTEQTAPGAAAPPRAVRVFVSSTFRDMQAERDELVKHTFPQLRKLCEQRGVTWGEVDLRWGITDEQAAEGRVLPICLAEIERCRPYFVGLLGERYGWVPEEVEPGLVERHPWLGEHLERSVTELEIVHGVLRDPAMADHAFFYLRDPAYPDSVPKGERPKLLERATKEEIKDLGAEEAERRAAGRRDRLEALKERVRTSGFPLEEGYPDPKALGALVLRDLTAVIDRLYPEGSEPGELEREAAEHEAFARGRAAVYVGRAAYFERLDAHAAAGGPPLVVLGESGAGKSALLSNWALGRREAHPDELVLMHFIGSSPYSTDWAAMLRRILDEFSGRLEIDTEIPDDPEELRRTFANGLHRAAARGRVVLVLDALNQLEDREGAPDLAWLPPAVPADVRVVLSTLPGRSLEELGRRGWPTLRVEPLAGGERERLITEYLAQSARALGPAHLGRVAGAPQCASPLYLRALLEELRVWGEHETLGGRIDHYLAAEAVDDLYELVLERYEEDYEDGRPGLVGDAMALIWAARRGLAEAELLDLLGSSGEPLPSARWSPLYLAAEQSLASRSGLLGFSHDYLRRAVAERYVPRPEDREAAHLRLADYFDPRREEVRGVDELPWQLAEAASWQPAEAASWQRLYELLADLPFLERAWEASEFDVKAHWARVEAGTPLRLADAYRPLLEAPGRHGDHLSTVARLLGDTGHPAEALSLREHQVRHYRQSGDRANLQAALRGQAVILYARGELDEATALLKEQERICRELGDRDGLSRSLGNRAVILYARGELDEATALHGEEERICRELGDRAGLSASLGNQALILQDRGELDRAMALYGEQERICRELGDRAGLSASLGNRAEILRARGELDGATALLKDEERICRELGDRAGLSRTLAGQALILKDRGELDEAMALHGEQERICRELGDRAGLSFSLGSQALILHARGEFDGATALLGEQERICRELGDRAGLSRSLGNQALILKDRGELNEAMALLKDAERICHELGDPNGLAILLTRQGLLLDEMGRGDEALSLVQEAHRIASEHGLTFLAQQVEAKLRGLQ